MLTWQVIAVMITVATLSLTMLAKMSKEKNIKEFTTNKSFIYTFGAYCGIAARRLLAYLKKWNNTIKTLALLNKTGKNGYMYKEAFYVEAPVIYFQKIKKKICIYHNIFPKIVYLQWKSTDSHIII